MKLTTQEVLSAVCDYYGVSVEEARAGRRHGNLVAARQIFCYIARKETKASLPRIGLTINRDKSTIWRSIDRAKDYSKLYSTVRNDIEVITNFIQNTKQGN